LKRWLPWITAAVLAAGLVWAFLYLKALHPFGSVGTDLGDKHLAGVALRFDEAALVGWADGEKVWRIQARTVDVSKDRRRATFRGITRGYLLKKGRRIASISANEVVYDTITHNISVPGTAEVEVEDGPSLKANDIYWNAATSRLECLAEVSATVNGSTVHGERMVADLEKKELKIWKVRGVIRLENE